VFHQRQEIGKKEFCYFNDLQDEIRLSNFDDIVFGRKCLITLNITRTDLLENL